METLQLVRVVGGCELSGVHRFEVGPHGDLEAVTLEHAWLDARIESRHRGVRLLRQASRELDFSRCAEPPHRRNSGDDVAWQQAGDHPVGVVENDRVIDGQVERRGDRDRCSHRTSRLRRLHRAILPPHSSADLQICADSSERLTEAARDAPIGHAPTRSHSADRARRYPAPARVATPPRIRQ